MWIFGIIVCGLAFSEARDRDKGGQSKDAIDYTKLSGISIYHHDELAQNSLCRVLECKESEVCIISKDNSSKCIKEKAWNKAIRSKQKSKKNYDKSKTSLPVSGVNDDCPACPVVHPVFVCGTDNVSYSSDCRLQYKNCVDKTGIKVACQGRCPCKSTDLYADFFDNNTPAVKPMKKIDMKNNGWLDDSTAVKENHVHVDKKVKTKSSNNLCSKKEMEELRFRLNEWFYTVFRQKVEEGSPEDFVQNPVCQDGPHHAVLSWIFLYFDEDRDNSLSLRELFDLEADKYEHCINPFLEFCDKNNDLEISGAEWCRCFQGKGNAKVMHRRHYRITTHNETMPA